MEIAEKNQKRIFGKCLIIFILIMLLCTVISRAADAMTVPKVTVDKPTAASLCYTLSGSGNIEATEQNTYLLPAGYLVESVLADGSRVATGDVLVQFQLEQLEEQLEERKSAVTTAQLALKQAKLNQTPDAWIPSADQAAKDLAAAQNTYNAAAAAYNAAAADAAAAVDGTGTMDEAGLAELKAQMDTASAAVTAAQTQLENAQANDEVTRTNTAKSQQSAGYTVEAAQQTLDEAERKLTETTDLLAQGGTVLAQEDGIFKNASLSAGTVTSGNEFLSIGTGALCYTAYVEAKAQSKLAVGDSIQIKPGGGSEVDATITEILNGADIQNASGTSGIENTTSQTDGTKSGTVIRASLPEDMELTSGYADFSIQKKSETTYDKVVPLTALHQDSQGYYYLGIRTKSSILGEEQVAERINVTVTDKDDDNAAVTGGFAPDTKIIIASERSINPGDRVRVIE